MFGGGGFFWSFDHAKQVGELFDLRTSLPGQWPYWSGWIESGSERIAQGQTGPGRCFV